MVRQRFAGAYAARRGRSGTHGQPRRRDRRVGANVCVSISSRVLARCNERLASGTHCARIVIQFTDHIATAMKTSCCAADREESCTRMSTRRTSLLEGPASEPLSRMTMPCFESAWDSSCSRSVRGLAYLSSASQSVQDIDSSKAFSARSTEGNRPTEPFGRDM